MTIMTALAHDLKLSLDALFRGEYLSGPGESTLLCIKANHVQESTARIGIGILVCAVFAGNSGTPISQ